MKFVKSNHRVTLKNEDGRFNSHSFSNVMIRFSGTRKSNKNFIPTITVHHLM